MAGEGVVFVFKCRAGHLTEKIFSAGTPYDDNDELSSCPECWKTDRLQTAYLIFAYPESRKKKLDAHRE